jgi:uncharacterized GH25 family protein
MYFTKRIALLAILLFTTAASAHDVFLKAKPFLLEKPGSTTLAMNLAEAFPGEEIKWRSEKTVKFWMIGPEKEQELVTKKESNPVIDFIKEGTFVIGWNALPSYIEIEPKLFDEYIKAEGYQNVIQMRTEKGNQDQPGREKYIRFLKCFVQVGASPTDNFSKSLGQKIELIPLENPYSKRIGSQLSVRVLFDDKPLPGARVMATYDTFSKEHDVYAHTVQTDADGIARIPIDKPGLWLVRANHMLPLQDDPKADWESYWTNFTFYVSGK